LMLDGCFRSEAIKRIRTQSLPEPSKRHVRFSSRLPSNYILLAVQHGFQQEEDHHRHDQEEEDDMPYYQGRCRNHEIDGGASRRAFRQHEGERCSDRIAPRGEATARYLQCPAHTVSVHVRTYSHFPSDAIFATATSTSSAPGSRRRTRPGRAHESVLSMS
jgi:hypothetical protein